MASSSSSRTQNVVSPSVTSRSILLDIEAAESDATDDETDSDDEATVAERARQATESVPLRNRDHINDVLRVANSWEKIALEQERKAVSSRNKGKRKAESPLASHRQGYRRKLPSPPPNASRQYVDTCMGRVYISRGNSPSPPPNHSRGYAESLKGNVYFYVEDIPEEGKTAREFRIYDVGEEVIKAVNREAISELRATQIAGQKNRAEHHLFAQATSSGNLDTPAYPTVLIDEEPTPDPTSLPQSLLVGKPSDSTRASSIKSDCRVTEGWKIVQRMLDNPEMTLDDARKEVEELFGTDGNNEIWSTISTLNDLDPDERQEGETRIALIVKQKLGKQAVATNTDVEMQSPSAEGPPSTEGPHSEGEQVQEDLELLEDQLHEQQLLARLAARSAELNLRDYQVFSLACRRGSELDAFNKITADIEAGRVHPSVLPYVFQSRYPGYIYILACSMLPKHTRLAAYLRTVPGLVYNRWYRITFPSENAWSRQNEKIKRPPPITSKAHDLHMPVHLRVQDVFFNDELIDEALPLDARATDVFQVDGTWVIIKSGRYRRDLGIIVNDDFNEVDRSRYAKLIVIPRIKYPGSSRTRPPKAPLPIDFTLSLERAWKSFSVSNNVTIRAICIEPTCSSGWVCSHQKNIHKRYQVYGQTLRGGFVLLEVKLDDLILALQVPDGDLAVFETIAGDGCLGRIPPPTSWTFREKEDVFLTHPHISVAFPSMRWREDLGNTTDGAEGVIQKVHDLVCEVAFKDQGEIVDVRTVGYRHLVKKLSMGQTVRLGPRVRPLKEIQWVQRGESGVLTMEEKQLELANVLGLVSNVYLHPLHGPSVSVWIQALSLIVALNPNSLVDASYSLTLLSGNSPRPAVANNALIPSHTATCDIRDVSVIERNHWQVFEKNLIHGHNLHPADYFSQIHLRKSLRIPWLGVRVTVDRNERPDRSGFKGEVIDIARGTENTDQFFVLVRWNHGFFRDHFDWCNYDQVRRVDNNGLLHEFTPYSGTSPWKGVKVKVITTGVYKDREGEVQDARADLHLDKDTVSGISVQILFQDGILFGERRSAWIDYHYVRRCDTRPMRFLHEGSIGDSGSKSYYTFKLGYLPVYSAVEVATWDSASRLPQDAIPENPMSTAASSPYFTFQAAWDSSSTEPDVPTNFWILDRRIWQTLKGREIYVARADRQGDLRLSIKHLGTGAITFQAHESRTGTRNQRRQYQQIHPGVISSTPWSCSIKRSEAANGLYIICDLEPYTGRLARRVRMTKSLSGDEKEDRWLLQLVDWASPPNGLDHTEALVQVPFIKTSKDHFVQVYETTKTAERANELMCRLRAGEQAPLNGYMINEHGSVVKESVRRGRQSKG